MVPRKATQFFHMDMFGFPHLDGPFESHHADPYTKKTFCGEDVENYPDGWTWGAPADTISCKICERIFDDGPH